MQSDLSQKPTLLYKVKANLDRKLSDVYGVNYMLLWDRIKQNPVSIIIFELVVDTKAPDYLK